MCQLYKPTFEEILTEHEPRSVRVLEWKIALPEIPALSYPEQEEAFYSVKSGAVGQLFRIATLCFMLPNARGSLPHNGGTRHHISSFSDSLTHDLQAVGGEQ